MNNWNVDYFYNVSQFLDNDDIRNLAQVNYESLNLYDLHDFLKIEKNFIIFIYMYEKYKLDVKYMIKYDDIIYLKNKRVNKEKLSNYIYCYIINTYFFTFNIEFFSIYNIDEIILNVFKYDIQKLKKIIYNNSKHKKHIYEVIKEEGKKKEYLKKNNFYREFILLNL